MKQNWGILLLLLAVAYGSNGQNFQGRAGQRVPQKYFTEHHKKHSLFAMDLSHMVVANTSVVDVTLFGAKGDGKFDNTKAFQDSLDYVSQNGGGIVWVPAGLWRFDGTFIIPTAVTLEGTYRSVPSHTLGEGGQLPNDGTILQAYAGRGQENGKPFITVSKDAVLRGVVIYYPEQVSTTIPVPYPFAISMNGNNAAVIDVELLNPYQGISAIGAARHYIARVQGQPAKTGIFVDKTYDIGRIEDVHFNPWFSGINNPYFDWQQNYGTAFTFARTDWEYMLNCFSFGYSVGYFFTNSSDGACSGNFVGIGADSNKNASILIDTVKPWGISIVNGEFTGCDAYCDENYSAELVVRETNTGSVRVSNSAFWGSTYSVASLRGGMVSFNQVFFGEWDSLKNGTYAVEVDNGSVVIQGSTFAKEGKQLRMGSDTKNVIFTGNMVAGGEEILNEGATNFQIGLNIFRA